MKLLKIFLPDGQHVGFFDRVSHLSYCVVKLGGVYVVKVRCLDSAGPDSGDILTPPFHSFDRAMEALVGLMLSQYGEETLPPDALPETSHTRVGIGVANLPAIQKLRLSAMAEAE